MKKIIPILLFVPLFFFVLLLVVSQQGQRSREVSKNTPIPTQIAQASSTPAEVSTAPTAEGGNQIDLIINTPESGSTVNDTSIIVSGTTGKHVYVAINDQDLVSSTDGAFKATVLLDEGENYISIVAYDDLGNSAEREIMITRTIEGL